MKNRILSLAVILCMVLSTIAVLPFTASAAASGVCGSNVIWELDSRGTLTISGSGNMDNYYYSGAPWYPSRSSIKSVVICDGITGIGDSAFENCDELMNVTLPDSVTSVGEYAFCGCESLANIILPDRITSIGACAFEGCKKIVRIVIPNGVKRIEFSTFSRFRREWRCSEEQR